MARIDPSLLGFLPAYPIHVAGGSMPLVRIDLLKGKTPEYREQIGQIVYRAMTETIGVPQNDRFQVITEHERTGLQFDRTYLGIQRSDDCIFLQITLNSGRTLEAKKRFYKAVADGLHEGLKVRREDVLINLVEVRKEDWSFGNGEAQYT
jgi:4-oxalocrotonate tautomerase